MDFLYVIIGLSIPLIFMFKTNWLMQDDYHFWLILIYCIALFLLTEYLLAANINFTSKATNSLRMPLISFLIFRLFLIVFKGVFRRNPQNTAWEFRKMPIQDIFFSFLFWIIGVGGPIFIVFSIDLRIFK